MRDYFEHAPLVAHHALKHGLSEADIQYAWRHYVLMQHRSAPNEGQMVAIGPRRNGHMIQMVATESPAGIVVFHALEPPTAKVLYELGLQRR